MDLFEPIIFHHLGLVKDVFAIEIISYTFNHFVQWFFPICGLKNFFLELFNFTEYTYRESSLKSILFVNDTRVLLV